MLQNSSGLPKKYSVFFYSPLLTFLTHMTFIFAGKNVPASSSVASKLPKSESHSVLDFTGKSRHLEK